MFSIYIECTILYIWLKSPPWCCDSKEDTTEWLSRVIRGWSMRLFIRRLGASRPCDWVTSLVLSFLLSKGLVGQTEWSQHFPDCGGTSQSPVDVVSTQTKYDPALIPVTPLGYSQLGHRPFTFYNNGHTGKYDNQPVSKQPYGWSVYTALSSAVTWQ